MPTTRPESTIDVVIPTPLLEAPVFGINLRSETLGGNLSPQGTLLVFLRHFGCIFCREMVADLRRQAITGGERDRVLFFYQGTVPEGREFFAEHWPHAQGIADQPLRFYQGFGVPKASLIQAFGPAVWHRGMKSFGKGHRPGKFQGDIRQMPGLLWVRDSRIVWRHDFEHAGDHPVVGDIPLFRLSVGQHPSPDIDVTSPK